MWLSAQRTSLVQALRLPASLAPPPPRARSRRWAVIQRCIPREPEERVEGLPPLLLVRVRLQVVCGVLVGLIDVFIIDLVGLATAVSLPLDSSRDLKATWRRGRLWRLGFAGRRLGLWRLALLRLRCIGEVVAATTITVIARVTISIATCTTVSIAVDISIVIAWVAIVAVAAVATIITSTCTSISSGRRLTMAILRWPRHSPVGLVGLVVRVRAPLGRVSVPIIKWIDGGFVRRVLGEEVGLDAAQCAVCENMCFVDPASAIR